MELYEYLTQKKGIPDEIWREYIEPMTRKKIPEDVAVLIQYPYKEWKITFVKRFIKRECLPGNCVRIDRFL